MFTTDDFYDILGLNRGGKMGALAYLISIITAFEISFATYLITEKFSFKYNNLICALVFLSVIAFSYLLQNLRYKCFAMKFNNKINMKSIEKMQKVVNLNSDIVLRVKLSILLSDYYNEKEDYKSALKALEYSMIPMSKSNKIFGMSKKFKVQYYSKCIYLYVVSNNLIMAQKSFEKGQSLFKNKKLKTKEKYEILRAISMFEYSKGNYQTSQKLSIQGIEQSSNRNQKEEFEFITAKCMSKLGFNVEADKKFAYLMKKSSNSYISRESREIIVQKNTR